jgi:hypothetical protein
MVEPLGHRFDGGGAHAKVHARSQAAACSASGQRRLAARLRTPTCRALTFPGCRSSETALRTTGRAARARPYSTSRAWPTTSPAPASNSAICAANNLTNSARSWFDNRAAIGCWSSAVVNACASASA